MLEAEKGQSSSWFPSMSNNSPDSEGKLLRLVYCDESGNLKTDPDVLRALRDIQGPAAAVSVCGPSHPTTQNSVFNELVGRNARHDIASKDRSPREGGLWMWSVPLKRKTVDGSQYNVIFLDGEGLDACDQTAAHNMQIFSLAVHLSSTVVYNLMGGIDETSSDDRSFAAETSKHIRTKVYGAKDTISELGQFSPSFVWLLKDLQSDTTRAAQKMTATDHQEHSWGSASAVQKDAAPANDICESFRGIFSDKECFALVRLLKDENGLQYLGCAMLEQFQSEHQSELAALTKFAYEKAVPKQVGGTVITGSVLASIIECYIDALNSGASSTVASLWQDVAESECRRAFQAAMRVYNSVFNQAKRLEEVPVEQAHSRALQSSVATYHAGAVGPGLARRKYEMLLQDFFDNSYKEAQNNADLHFSSAIDKMKNGFESACQGPAVKFDDINKVLDGILLEYEALERSEKSDQPSLTRSMLGPLFEHFKKAIGTVLSEKDVLMSKCCTMEEKEALLRKNLEASEKLKSEYQVRYEDAIRDMNNLSRHYKNRIMEIESNCRSLEGKCSSLHEMLDCAKQESLDWKCKYEEVLFTKRKDVGDDLNDIEAGSKSSDARRHSWCPESKSTADQGQSVFTEARQWKDKYDLAVNEAKVAAEKAEKEVKSLTDEAKLREEALRIEFSNSLAKKDEEVKNLMVKVEDTEQRLNTLTLEVQAAEEKMRAYGKETSDSKLQWKKLNDKYESVKASVQLLESEAQIKSQEKAELEQKYLAESKRLEEIQLRCKLAEEKLNAAQMRLQEKTDLEQKYLSDSKRLEAKCELAEEEVNAVRIELQEKIEYEHKYMVELETLRETHEKCNEPKTEQLEEMLKNRDEEIGQWKTKCEALEDMLRSGGIVNHPPFEPGSLEAQLQSIQQHLYSEDQVDETVLSTPSKRAWLEVATPAESLASDGGAISRKRRRKGEIMMMSSSLQKCTSIEAGSESTMKAGEEEDGAESQKASSVNYARLTVARMRQELNEGGYGGELLKLKGAKKKDIYALYKKHILKN